MPTPLELILSSVPAAALTCGSVLLWRATTAGLRGRGATPRQIWVNRATQLAAVPASFAVELLAPWPLSTILLAAVCYAYGVAITPGVQVWIGERRARRVGSAQREPPSGLREIWEELEGLTAVGVSPAQKKARYEALAARLQGPWEGPEAALAEALLRQSELWVFPPDQWSLGIVEGEIELYERALDLWPDNPPAAPAGVLPAPILWRLFRAYQAYAETWRLQYTVEELSRRRAALDAVRLFGCPETASFLETITRLFSVGAGEADATQDEVYELVDVAQDQMDVLFPSVRVFRGAHVADPS